MQIFSALHCLCSIDQQGDEIIIAGARWWPASQQNECWMIDARKECQEADNNRCGAM